jgi:soluble lytic murein transglycosylase-like protein
MEVGADGTVSIRSGAGAANWQVMAPASNEPSQDAEAPAIPATAITAANDSLIPEQYSAAVHYAAASVSISPTLLAALVWQESRWNPQAVSNKGAMGLTQLMPGTARDLGVDPTNPYANLVGGARYLRQMLNEFGGDVEKALAAYNAGAGRVRNAGGVPAIAETRNYVASIVRRISAGTTGGK